MNKYALGLGSVCVGLLALPAGAGDLPPTLGLGNTMAQPRDLDQVNNVFQLRDLSPQDWAFDALRNLVDRYNCLQGYPDRTFRGDRFLSRYEFAAGLNACMGKLEAMVAGGTQVDPNDLATLKRMAKEFKTELAALTSKVDALEGRTKFLEDHQFSTTSRLFGQVVMGIQAHNDYKFNAGGTTLRSPSNQLNMVSNAQLSLFTQFSPRSLLLTGLQYGSGSTAAPGDFFSNFTALGYEGNTGGSLQISDLTYRHLVNNRLALMVGTAGVNAVNVFRGANRVESTGFGSLSRFAQRNPIIAIGSGQTGIGFDWQVARRLSFQGVYTASNGANPTTGGLFGGAANLTTTAIQAVISPTDRLDLSLQYVNSYSPLGLLGAGVGDDLVALAAPVQTNAYGGSLDWRPSSQIALGGWVGFTKSNLQGLGGGQVDTNNWMVYLNLPDLFRKGNVGGLYVGQPPKITRSNLPVGLNIPDFITTLAGNPGGEPGTTTHVEAYYRMKVNNNITITPGVIVLFNPGHNAANQTVTIGAIRTTLSF